MELYKLRYNLYNYLIKNNFDYNNNKDYLILWKKSLIIVFIFLILIIVANYNRIELYSILIVVLIIIFLYIIYFDMNNYINSYDNNKYLISYKDYYETLNAIFNENYDFTKDDDLNNNTNLINIKNPKDILTYKIKEKLSENNKDIYDAYIKTDNNKEYLYLKLNNYIYENYDYITKINNYKNFLLSSVMKNDNNIYLIIDNLQISDNSYKNLVIPEQTRENTNIYYIKLNTTELDRNKLINFKSINDLINDLIDKLNTKKNTNNFINQIKEYTELIEYLQTYMNVIKRIKYNIKYNENKTNNEINEKIYNNLVINNDVLKYIDIYNDPDIQYLKDFIFIKFDSFIIDSNYNNFFKIYRNNKSKKILLNNNTEELVSNLILEIKKNSETYYFININKLNNLTYPDKYPFIKELITYINNKYKLNYENLNILYKSQNINQNTEFLKIVNNFDYLYIKVIIIIIIIIAIIIHAFYREFIRYIR